MWSTPRFSWYSIQCLSLCCLSAETQTKHNNSKPNALCMTTAQLKQTCLKPNLRGQLYIPYTLKEILWISWPLINCTFLKNAVTCCFLWFHSPRALPTSLVALSACPLGNRLNAHLSKLPWRLTSQGSVRGCFCSLCLDFLSNLINIHWTIISIWTAK